MDPLNIIKLAKQGIKLIDKQKIAHRKYLISKVMVLLNLFFVFILICFSVFSITPLTKGLYLITACFYLCFFLLFFILMEVNSVKYYTISVLLNQLNEKLEGGTDVRKPRRPTNRRA